MTIFERTQQLAKEQGITLRELESKSGLADKALYKWKTYNPRVENVQKVADVLNVSVDYLLGNTDEKNPHPVEDEENALAPGIREAVDKAIRNAQAYDGKPITQDEMDEMSRLITAWLISGGK